MDFIFILGAFIYPCIKVFGDIKVQKLIPNFVQRKIIQKQQQKNNEQEV